MPDAHPISPRHGWTLERHLFEQQRATPGATGDFTGLFQEIALAGRIIASQVRSAGLANLLGLIPPITGLTIQLATPLAALRGPEPNEPPEVTLERYARSEREKRNWFAHVGPIFLNLAVAALQLFVVDRPVTAGLQVGIGITLSQTQLWTSPRVATRASP